MATPDLPETMPVIRWQCDCGRFIAESAITSQECIDPSGYYGVTCDSWYDCSRCGRRDTLPRLVMIGEVPCGEL